MRHVEQETLSTSPPSCSPFIVRRPFFSFFSSRSRSHEPSDQFGFSGLGPNSYAILSSTDFPRRAIMKSVCRRSAMLFSIVACYPSRSLAGPLEAGRLAPSALEPVPFQLGARAFEVGNCRAWSKSNAWDTCQDYLDRYSLTMAQFYKLNPSVQSDCFSFTPGETYCRRTSMEKPTDISLISDSSISQALGG